MKGRFVYLSLLCLLAVVARVGFALYQHAPKSPSAMEHKVIATSLVYGTGYTFGDMGYYGPTSVQSPVFPFILAASFKLFHAVGPGPTLIQPNTEHAYLAVMCLNALAGGGLVFLVYLMTRTLGGNTAAALLAATVVAVWPTQIYAARTVQAIALITCGLAGMVILYYKSVRTGRAGPWVAFSIVATVSTLTEPVLLPALILSGVMMLFARELITPIRFRNAGILAVAILGIIGPWTTRNYIVHGKLIPIKGSFWVNVWKGNNDYATGTDRLKMTPAEQAEARRATRTMGEDDIKDSPHQYDMLDPSQRARLVNHPEADREVVWKEFAMKWITTHPKRFVQLCGIRLFKTLTVDWDNPRTYSPVYLGSHALLMLLTVGGLYTAIRQHWSLLYPAMIALTCLGSYTFTVTAARFGIPFEPVQLALGSAWIVAIYQRVTAASAPRGFEPIMQEQPPIMPRRKTA